MVLLHVLHVLSYFSHAVSDLLDLGGVQGAVTVAANSNWLPPSITQSGRDTGSKRAEIPHKETKAFSHLTMIVAEFAK